MKKNVVVIICLFTINLTFGQENRFEKLDFLIGEWSGNGSGSGNNKSEIKSSFNYVMNKRYIEVINDSKFEPTEKNPKGEHHIDKGYISYDRERKSIIFRQFHIEGFVNQYYINDSISNDSTIVFETEIIENLSKGKARWTISKISETEYEATFEVSFTGKEFVRYGVNNLKKIVTKN